MTEHRSIPLNTIKEPNNKNPKFTLKNTRHLDNSPNIDERKKSSNVKTTNSYNRIRLGLLKDNSLSTSIMLQNRHTKDVELSKNQNNHLMNDINNIKLLAFNQTLSTSHREKNTNFSSDNTKAQITKGKNHVVAEIQTKVTKNLNKHLSLLDDSSNNESDKSDVILITEENIPISLNENDVDKVDNFPEKKANETEICSKLMKSNTQLPNKRVQVFDEIPSVKHTKINFKSSPSYVITKTSAPGKKCSEPKIQHSSTRNSNKKSISLNRRNIYKPHDLPAVKMTRNKLDSRDHLHILNDEANNLFFADYIEEINKIQIFKERCAQLLGSSTTLYKIATTTKLNTMSNYRIFKI